MKKKLVIYNVIITVVVLLLMFGLGLIVTNSNYKELSEKKIKEITAVYCANYSEDTVFPADDDVRVTVIDAAGNVIADSSGQISGENHIGREEIQAALNGAPAVCVRTSDTLGKEMMYYAEKVTVGESYVFIRVAIPMESVYSYALKSIVPMLAILLVAFTASAVASALLSGVILKPLNQVKDGLSRLEEGKYQKLVPATGDDDIDCLLVGINDLSERLQDNMRVIENERRQLGCVLSNVTDGIAVVDSSLNIVIANRSLKQIFGVNEPEGRNIEVLTSDGAFVAAVTDCAQNRRDSVFEMEHGGKYFLCAVRYTEGDWAIAVLSDITRTKEGEKMRLEFFANASHELKTPLTSIKGFNDMITLKSADGEIKEYSARIEKEIDRVIKLLSDMLDLSKIENSSLKEINLAPVDVKEVADEVVEALKPLCAQKEVTLSADGAGTVLAEREHIYELIKNLAENGVRYNNSGGTVKISVDANGDGVKLTVEDDGIGIDSVHQGRIFERFYRVDKSRSRASGGTGLGLAIVKHISDLYGAKLSLKSKLGCGTTITVIFGR